MNYPPLIPRLICISLILSSCRHHVKSYRKVYYWQRPSHEPVWKTLRRPPSILPYIVEPQGEAIGFNLEATGYYTVSEGVKPELYYYQAPY